MEQTNISNEQIAVIPAQRFNIYATIHKALRAFMCDTLVMAGSMDESDKQEVADGLAQVRALIALCASHLEHENEFVHTAMEARRPGSSTQIAAEHVQHEEALAQLTGLAAAVEHASGAARANALLQLYRRLALFAAENLAHMHVEETQNNAVLWATHSDEELAGIEQAIVASIPPEETAAVMRWMIPAMNATERVEMLSGVRRDPPPPVFEALLGIARTNLSKRDWRKLSEALELSEPMAA